MKEQTKRSAMEKTGKEEKKKDNYTSVMVMQIIAAAVLFLLFSGFIKPSESHKTELLSLIKKEMFDISSAAVTLRDYLKADGAWAVFGANVTYSYEEETSYEALSGTGGDDLSVYEAAKNTSFARIKTTSPAVSPVENGRYTSYFGYRINPITGKFSFHTGLDIAAKEGTKIRAAYSGTVTKTGEDERAGKYIFLTHDDGFVTFYCHCSEILADEGAIIRQGETIARVGSTGRSTGPHLHFEIRKDNIRYNPLFVLDNDL